MPLSQSQTRNHSSLYTSSPSSSSNNPRSRAETYGETHASVDVDSYELEALVGSSSDDLDHGHGHTSRTRTRSGNSDNHPIGSSSSTRPRRGPKSVSQTGSLRKTCLSFLRYLPLPPRLRLTCLVLTLFFLSLPLLLIIIALIIFIAPHSSRVGGVRLCVPFNLHRFSAGAHYRLSCNSELHTSSDRPYSSTTTSSSDGIDISPIGMSSGTASPDVGGATGAGKAYPSLGRLAGWLQAQKEAFITDVKDGKGKGWVVVMGNEAGDLDTIASSIAYAHLSSVLQAERMVPLLLTPSSMMGLRPENLLALKNASVPLSVLLHPESLPIATADLAGLGVRFALVDHNKLLPQFGPIKPGIVQGVIDHHDDEGQHSDAEVRVIEVPTGSCSSLVTNHFSPGWQAALSSPAGEAGSPIPNEVATLLLSAGLIDTHGFKAGGKAMPADYSAAAFCYPLSPWVSSAGSVQAVSDQFIPPSLHDQAKELNDIKHNVSFLSTHDLLWRDYKEYNLPTANSSFPSLRVGLSTVPLGLKDWLEKEGGGGWETYLKAVDKFMEENKLDVEGVLTTFKSKKGKKKREILLVVRVGGALDHASAERAANHLATGLEADTILSLVKWEKKGWKRFLNSRKKRTNLDGKRRFGRVWEQANAEATRKVVAPLIRDLVLKFQ